jgi:nucleoid-associated protein YgaU
MVLVTLMTGPAAAAREVTGPAAQTAGTTYTVVAGDNLSSIAQRAYGNANSWNVIWNANNWIVNPNYLLPGWKIVIPPPPPSTGGVTPTPAPAPTTTTYVVQRGDSLSTIAMHYFGNAASWACIWAANTWIVNPSYILPGWVITIPANCGASSGGGPPAPRYHTVQRGETLSGIACYYYADCNYWRIYNANTNVIWNINYVQAGWVLRIP